MTILASDLTKRLARTLHDITKVRWPEDEMYESIDDAQKALLEARPDMFEVTEPVQMILGPKQPVPADCYSLFDLAYNLSADMDPISTVTKVERPLMDRAVTHWMSEPSDTQVDHWMQSEREREFFWVYPPVGEDPETSQPGWVEMRYARRPGIISGPGTELGVTDEGINGVYYFAMMRLLEKDEKFAGSPQAEMFLTKFGLVVGAKTEGEKQTQQIRETEETA